MTQQPSVIKDYMQAVHLTKLLKETLTQLNVSWFETVLPEGKMIHTDSVVFLVEVMAGVEKLAAIAGGTVRILPVTAATLPQLVAEALP